MNRPAKRAKGSGTGEGAIVVKGIEPAIEALRDVQRIQALNASEAATVARLETLIRRLRLKATQSKSPLLSTLADALEDALIQTSR